MYCEYRGSGCNDGLVGSLSFIIHISFMQTYRIAKSNEVDGQTNNPIIEI